MIGSNISRLLVAETRGVLQKRCQSVISGPPSNHVTAADKVILGGGMCLSLFFFPAWVLYHIREYKGDK